MDLPGREEVASWARRYRIEGYDLDDIIQEIYLALLDPECDGDWERHLRSLKRRTQYRATRLQAVVLRRAIPDRGEWLVLDNTLDRVSEDLGALELLIACESECVTPEQLALLKMLAMGYGYRSIARELRIRRHETARYRVRNFRRKLYRRVYQEELV